ncbi:ASCH domain-containing protein [Siccibacter colletis]|uniref:ASCH domain-containing protein n=1 Tax=Siccibacter colletis TaxID=1505757 RepID=UPI0004E1A54C|nr:ASCH domain-containing protein [Siccibacter colletis]
MDTLTLLKQKYPAAHVWAFGDSPELADELLNYVVHGDKRATCSAASAFHEEGLKVVPGDYHIVLNGAGEPACVIRTLTLRLVRFCDVTPELAALEGEGDKSLAYWRDGHESFFTRAGCYAPDMELIFEEFSLIETLP